MTPAAGSGVSRSPECGMTLAEMLVVVAILGLIVVMIAPIEAYLLRTLGEAETTHANGILEIAAGRLTTDARAAEDCVTGLDGAVVFRQPGGGRVEWRPVAGGVERTATVTGREAPTLRRFTGIALARIETESPEAFEAELRAADGSLRRIAVLLRNSEERP